MVNLLYELNKHKFTTCAHCCGHGVENKYVVFKYNKPIPWLGIIESTTSWAGVDGSIYVKLQTRSKEKIEHDAKRILKGLIKKRG